MKKRTFLQAENKDRKMKVKTSIFLLIFLLPMFVWTQSYEITEIDIFSLKNMPNSEEITLYGISTKNKLREALEKFNKTEADLTRRGDGPYILEISRGLLIRSFDKENIHSFLLRDDGKDNLKGKTSEYFNLAKDVDFLEFLVKHFGKPDYIYHKEPVGNVMGARAILYYLNGFIFDWWDLKSTIASSIVVTSRENVLKKANENGAKEVIKTSGKENQVPRKTRWKKVAQWEGKVIKDTETFRISSTEWRISWETKPGEYDDMNFQIYVYKSNGDLISVAANVIGYNNDSTIIRGAGSYYLSINTAQPYSIVVEERR